VGHHWISHWSFIVLVPFLSKQRTGAEEERKEGSRRDEVLHIVFDSLHVVFDRLLVLLLLVALLNFGQTSVVKLQISDLHLSVNDNTTTPEPCSPATSFAPAMPHASRPCALRRTRRRRRRFCSTGMFYIYSITHSAQCTAKSAIAQPNAPK
jgi:hypothetical protein